MYIIAVPGLIYWSTFTEFVVYLLLGKWILLRHKLLHGCGTLHPHQLDHPCNCIPRNKHRSRRMGQCTACGTNWTPDQLHNHRIESGNNHHRSSWTHRCTNTAPRWHSSRALLDRPQSIPCQQSIRRGGRGKYSHRRIWPGSRSSSSWTGRSPSRLRSLWDSSFGKQLWELCCKTINRRLI